MYSEKMETSGSAFYLAHAKTKEICIVGLKQQQLGTFA